MPNLLTWFQGNRNPSISETITTGGGTAFDLTNSTVKFKMRAIGSATLKVDAAAVIVSAAAGTVRHDWLAADVDVASPYLVWWEITTAGKTQDMNEALVDFLAHAPVARDYVELEDLKKTLRLDGLSDLDLDIREVITTASRKAEDHCERRFWADTDANQVRYYTPSDTNILDIDDIVTITSIKTDDSGDGTYENTLAVNTDFIREPLNAAADGRPWERISVHPTGTHFFPTSYPRSVEITGKFGWLAVPSTVKTATKLIAHRYVKRLRETPLGIAGFGMDGAVVRIMSVDPDVAELLEPYLRRRFR